MAQFDIDKAKSIIASGDQTRIDGMLADIARHLRTKKYGLVFETGGGGSSDSAFETEQVVADYRENIPYPVFRDDLSLNVDKFDGNMLLEGNNYIWLQILAQTHKGKIDVIYIDPPYNTGNKDFTYNDTFVGKDDCFRHSKWLDFMDKRLRIARELLSESGVFFISVDANEMANVSLLCNEIFGENNRLAPFIWVSNIKGRQLSASGAAQTYEYVLSYAKECNNAPEFRINRADAIKLMPSIYADIDANVMHDDIGDFIVTNELYNSNSVFNEETSPSLIFDIYYCPSSGDIITSDVSEDNLYKKDGYIKIAPHKNADGKHKYHAFRWSRKKIADEGKTEFTAPPTVQA